MRSKLPLWLLANILEWASGHPQRQSGDFLSLEYHPQKWLWRNSLLSLLISVSSRTIDCKPSEGEFMYSKASMTNLDFDTLRKHFQPSPSMKTNAEWCREIFHMFACQTVVHWHNGVFWRFMARVRLDIHNRSFHLLRQALIESRLGPVDAKVPISWSCSRWCILLENGACDVDLFSSEIHLSKLAAFFKIANLFEDLSNKQTRRSCDVRLICCVTGGKAWLLTSTHNQNVKIVGLIRLGFHDEISVRP
jgi:hypothetical protein